MREKDSGRKMIFTLHIHT